MADYESGFDVRFTVPALSDGAWIGAEGTFSIVRFDTSAIIALKRVGTTLEWQVYRMPGTNLDKKFPCSGSYNSSHNIRIVMHRKFVSVYIDNRWDHTFAFQDMLWASRQIGLRSSGSVTVTNIVSRELCASKEAIYIDLESNGISAIQSIIQDRPVEIAARSTGEMIAGYTLGTTSVAISNHIRSHVLSKQSSDTATESAIVYYTDVGIVTDEVFLREDGFSTKVYRLSSMDNDAMDAARELIVKSRERQKMHTVSCRPLLDIEIGDIMPIVYTKSGAPLSFSKRIYVDSINMSISNGESSMNISGREAES